MVTAEQAIKLMADAAIEQGEDANDSHGIVRAIVTAHNLGFNAWLCVCCEIADRSAQAEGFKNQLNRAAAKMSIMNCKHCGYHRDAHGSISQLCLA